MRILALDWGSVRIGAAISDPDGRIAFPLSQVIDNKGSMEEIQKIIQELAVDKILVGLPKGMSGQETESTVKAESFIEKIKEKTGIMVETADERLSSVAAGRALAEQGVSEKDQRGIKDNIAAQLMLQQYLDIKNN